MSRIQLMTSMKRTSPTIQLKCIDLEDNEEYQKLINGEIDQQTMVYQYHFDIDQQMFTNKHNICFLRMLRYIQKQQNEQWQPYVMFSIDSNNKDGQEVVESFNRVDEIVRNIFNYKTVLRVDPGNEEEQGQGQNDLMQQIVDSDLKCLFYDLDWIQKGEDQMEYLNNLYQFIEKIEIIRPVWKVKPANLVRLLIESDFNGYLYFDEQNQQILPDIHNELKEQDYSYEANNKAIEKERDGGEYNPGDLTIFD